MKMLKFMCAATLALAVGATTPLYAQHGDHDRDHRGDKDRHEDHGRGHGDHGRDRHDFDHGRDHGRGEHRDFREDRRDDHHFEREEHEGHHYGRISDEHYHRYFGREHRFRIHRPLIIAGHPRFQYGGYWFVIGQPLPRGWRYDDDVYVDYIDGGYYMCSPAHPHVRIVLNIL